MTYFLTVDFGDDRTFDFRVPAGEVAGLDADVAQQWIDAEYTKLGFTQPPGLDLPQLVADKVLKIAQASGIGPFAARSDWAQQYARHVCVLVGRPNLLVDVPGFSVGF